jgi:uncharacterized membrane protein
MYLIPFGCLIIILLALSLPLLFFLVFFRIINFGFGNLGFSEEATFLILLLIFAGSLVDIPLSRQKKFYIEKTYFFSLFKKQEIISQGITINLGGAIIPILISIFFLTKVPLRPTLLATALMIVIAYSLSKIVPGRGIVLPAFIPPISSAVISLILVPGFSAPVAFISGVMGVLIGADFLKIRKIKKIYQGNLSIGGAGVFDGIFLVGIVSAFLAGF